MRARPLLGSRPSGFQVTEHVLFAVVQNGSTEPPSMLTKFITVPSATGLPTRSVATTVMLVEGSFNLFHAFKLFFSGPIWKWFADGKPVAMTSPPDGTSTPLS